jgi:hypothetical protein
MLAGRWQGVVAMAIHQVSAVFTTHAEADRIARMLVGELNIPYAAVSVRPLGDEPPIGYDASNLWDAAATGPTYSLFVTEESREAYREELRRGRMQLTALVDERDVVRAVHLLEQSGALALYEGERELEGEANRPRQLSDAAGHVAAAVGSPADVSDEKPRDHPRVRSYPIESERGT